MALMGANSLSTMGYRSTSRSMITILSSRMDRKMGMMFLIHSCTNSGMVLLFLNRFSFAIRWKMMDTYSPMQIATTIPVGPKRFQVTE